jgi:hypothetical protein
MLSLNATQQAILAAKGKKIKWLFTVTDVNAVPTTYHWSTKNTSYDGTDYDFAVIPGSFAGVAMNRSRSEIGIQGPDTLKFTVHNKGNILSALDFDGGTVVLSLVMSGGGYEAVVRYWKFRIETCAGIKQTLAFTCVDFFSYLLEGQYPNSKHSRALFPSDESDDNDNVCPPVPFGTAYVPLKYVLSGGSRYYLIGPNDGATYTITAIRSPRSKGAKIEFQSTSYTFTQSVITDTDGNDWVGFNAIIAASKIGLDADSPGFWMDGDKFLNTPVKYSKSDTSSKTSPADVLEYVVEDMGADPGDINSTSFAAAKAVFASWGLQWNGAFWATENREPLMARLLSMCHSVLDAGVDLSLRILSGTSVATVTAEQILKTSGQSTFSVSVSSRRGANDGGDVLWQQDGEAQDAFIKSLVPTGASSSNPATATMDCPFVQDSQHVQKLAILNYQRKFFKRGECSFSSKSGSGSVYPAAFQTDDVITISGENYGGTYDVLIDNITIRRGGQVDVKGIILSNALDDWGDISPAAISPGSDTSISGSWSSVTSGPSTGDGNSPNETEGDILIKRGKHIILAAGGAVKSDSKPNDFEISPDVGFLGKGAGFNFAPLVTSAYDNAPVSWYSPESFTEVVVSYEYPSSPTNTFYCDAFKQNIASTLTVTAVEDRGTTWKITFTGASLGIEMQIGNLVDPGWSSPWHVYLQILHNGANWVEVTKGSAIAPVATDTFGIHGLFAARYGSAGFQWPYAMWFDDGDNAGAGSVINSCDYTSGLVVLTAAMSNNIVAGNTLRAYDQRVILEYGWNNKRVILAPSSRCPDDITLYIGAGGTHPGAAFHEIDVRAKDAIRLVPGYGLTSGENEVRVEPWSWAYGPAHFNVVRGNLRVSDGCLVIKDGITAPGSSETGMAMIYVDDADGDLKIRFANGTIKTISIDT